MDPTAKTDEPAAEQTVVREDAPQPEIDPVLNSVFEMGSGDGGGMGGGCMHLVGCATCISFERQPSATLFGAQGIDFTSAKLRISPKRFNTKDVSSLASISLCDEKELTTRWLNLKHQSLAINNPRV